jgi:hypothetical protein
VQTNRLTIAAWAILALAARAQDTAGYVVALKGVWLASPGVVQLAPGRPVAGGIRLESKDAGASITVAFLDGSAKTFTAPFTVESVHAAAKSGTSRMLSAVSKSLQQEKRAAIFGISRGSSDVRPAVLKQTGRRVDLGPALGSLPSGEYSLELTPVDGAAPVAAKCNLDPPSATSATIALAPGAYQLRVANAGGTPFGSATVLIASAADFDAKTAAFQEGVAATASWPSDTDPAAIRQFLAALLIGLP